MNISRLHRGMCQLEKPPANEITEPLAFTVSKLELRWKAIVLQSCSRCTRFNRSQLWAKRNESDVLRQNKNTPRSKCRSAGSKRHTFWPWSTKDKTKGKKRTSTKQKQTEEIVPQRSLKNARRTMTNPTMKNNPRLWKLLSRNIAFFCFPLFFSYWLLRSEMKR